MYLRHMDKYHQYRPGSKYEEIKMSGAESISGMHLWDLKSGTGIFSKQLCWDSANNRFLCPYATTVNELKMHKFGLGMCQWTDLGNNPTMGPGPIGENDLGRLPKLIKRYLNKFGEYHCSDRDECLELETDYLLEEFQNYSGVAGIHKEDCTLEKATEDFLKDFENPEDLQSKLTDRTRYAKAILEALRRAGIHGTRITD